MEIRDFEPLFGNWIVDSFIGAGSFGKVYKIKREDYNAVYYAALKWISIPQDDLEMKQLHESGLNKAGISTFYKEQVEQLTNETFIMSNLRGNSNIVSYDDHIVIPRNDGIGYDVFIRMELLTSLNDYISNHSYSQSDVIKLGIDLCNALEVCQMDSIIHRDIKPGNIFISKDNNFKLGDFGIAKRLEQTMANLSKKGTYNYMAPEVYKGRQYGTNVDIYSLGLVMYWLLNERRLPFYPPAPKQISSGDMEEALMRRMRKGEIMTPPINGGVRLGEIILKACSYLPKDRYSSPQQMREELQAIHNYRYRFQDVNRFNDTRLINKEKLGSGAISEEKEQEDADDTRSAFGQDAQDDNSFREKPIDQQPDGGTRKKDPKGGGREKKRRRRRRQKRILIMVSAVVVIALVLGVTAFFIRSHQKSVEQSTQVQNVDLYTGSISVLTDSTTDEVYFDIDLYAPTGSKIHIISNTASTDDVVIKSDDYIALRLPRDVFMPNEPVESETITIAPNIQAITPGGETKQIAVPEITVAVPVLSMTIIEPSTDTINATWDNMPIVILGQVNDYDGDIAVFVNEEQAYVEGPGLFTASYTPRSSQQREGDTPGEAETITIEARKNNCVTARNVITVEPYVMQTMSFTVINDLNGLSSAEGSVTLTGTVTPGATITATSSSTDVSFGQPTVTETGTFTMIVSIAKVGAFDVNLIGVLPGYYDGSANVIVERPPSVSSSSFIKSAADMIGVYDKIVSGAIASGDFYFTGAVTEIIATDPYTIYRVQISEGVEVIVVNRSSKATINSADLGEMKQIGGSLKGLYSDGVTPYVWGWFFLNK